MVAISFEFFPPKTDPGRDSLRRTATDLAAFGPTFLSVTYGAAGSDQERSLTAVNDLVDAVAHVPVAAHLTTIGATAGELQATIDRIAALGIRHLVALRGDRPEGDRRPVAYPSAAALVEAVRARPDGASFDISVAAYPEVHPRAASRQADLDSLKEKLDAGADRALTQFFFDPEVFLRFADRARAAGITRPLVPGIMPITSFSNVSRFADRCGASVPSWLNATLGPIDDDPELQAPVAASIAVEQCRRLIAEGVDDLHFYTMNKRQLPAAVCHALGLGPLAATTAPSPNGGEPALAASGASR